MPDPDASGDERHLTALRLRAHDLAAPFAVSGEVTAPSPPLVRLTAGVRVPLDPRDWGLASALRRAFERALGGDGAARAAAPGSFRLEGLDLDAAGVLDAVRRSLFPGDAAGLQAELTGMGFGAPGEGSDEGGDATLLLYAPSSFTGGALTLTQRGLAERFEATFYRGATQATFPWVAWRAGVERRAEPVADGACVTLAWRLSRAADAPRAQPAGTHADRFAGSLVEALADDGFAPDAAALGFACTRSYAGELSVARGDEDGITEGRLRVLDGRDRAVAAAALRLGLTVRLVAYAMEANAELRWALARTLHAGERVVCRRKRLTVAAVEKDLPVTVPCDRDRVLWVVRPPVEGAAGAQDVDAPAEPLGVPEFSETGDFEGDGREGVMLLYAALLVRLPTRAEREALVAAHRAAVAREAAAAVTKPAPEAKPAAVAREKPAAVAKEKPAVAAKEKPAVAVKEKPAVAAKAPVGEELTAGQLRALGYGPAEVKRLVASGALEKTGFGWYRFARAP